MVSSEGGGILIYKLLNPIKWFTEARAMLLGEVTRAEFLALKLEVTNNKNDYLRIMSNDKTEILNELSTIENRVRGVFNENMNELTNQCNNTKNQSEKVLDTVVQQNEKINLGNTKIDELIEKNEERANKIQQHLDHLAEFVTQSDKKTKDSQEKLDNATTELVSAQTKIAFAWTNLESKLIGQIEKNENLQNRITQLEQQFNIIQEQSINTNNQPKNLSLEGFLNELNDLKNKVLENNSMLNDEIKARQELQLQMQDLQQPLSTVKKPGTSKRKNSNRSGMTEFGSSTNRPTTGRNKKTAIPQSALKTKELPNNSQTQSNNLNFQDRSYTKLVKDNKIKD